MTRCYCQRVNVGFWEDFESRAALRSPFLLYSQKRNLKPRFLLFIPALIWVIVIYVLLTLPESDLPQSPVFDIIYFDKWVHIGLFATLVFLFSFPLKKSYSSQSSVYLFVVLAAIAYGIAMEFVQKFFTSDRSFDVTDMIADAAGCFIGYAFIKFQLKRREARSVVKK